MPFYKKRGMRKTHTSKYVKIISQASGVLEDCQLLRYCVNNNTAQQIEKAYPTIILKIYFVWKYPPFSSSVNDMSPRINRTSQYVAEEKGAKNKKIKALSSKGITGKIIPNKAEIKNVVMNMIKTTFIPKRLSDNFIIYPPLIFLNNLRMFIKSEKRII